MNAELIVFFVVASGLMYYVGVQIGQGNYIVGIITLAIILGFFIIIKVAKRARIEAVLLTVLIMGYMVGGRGFAYINLAGIWIGEFLMILIFIIIAWRMLFGESPVVMHKIFIPVVIFAVFCSFRFIFLDFPQYRNQESLRDFCSVYYIIFMVFAYAISNHEDSYAFIRKSLTFVFYITFIISMVEIMRPSLLWKVSVLSRVKDTSAFTLIASGLYFAYLYKTQIKLKQLHFILSLASMAGIFATEARTGYVAFAACVLIMLLFGQFRYVVFQFIIIAICGFGIVIFTLSGGFQNEHNKVASVAYHILSLIDVNNETQSDELKEAQNTNTWRLLWWGVIWDEVRASPDTLFMGLGFGYHLGANFAEEMLRELYGVDVVENMAVGENYEARSPHNFLMTIVGRTGIIGISVITIFGIMLFALTISTARRVRYYNHSFLLLFWALLPMSIFIQSWFSIVLEGPYGAIPFWSLLGMTVNDVVRGRYYLGEGNNRDYDSYEKNSEPYSYQT